MGLIAQINTAPNPKGETIKMVGMMTLLAGSFYFILLRPQQRKAKDHAEVLKTLKPGDKVLTSGGILGVIVTVKEKSVSLRSADSKFEVLKSAISDITERGSEVKEL